MPWLLQDTKEEEEGEEEEEEREVEVEDEVRETKEGAG